MSASNFRVHECNTVHHLISRIAHKVFFLGDEERNDFLNIVRRSAAFSGVRLLGWCIMTNHFHLLVHLPLRIELDEEELLRRYQILKGEAGRFAAEEQLKRWRQANNLQQAEDWLEALRRRMYDVGEYMKLVKQWFTEEYNRRNSHVGTLWESVYHDRLIPLTVKDMRQALGYINLNPVNAAVCAVYDAYAWSSFHAAVKGDELALAGLRFVYDDSEASQGELISRHVLVMDDLLDGLKRKRAEEIARKREAGYELPVDQLTSEAMVAQAAAHLQKVQESLVELRAVHEKTGRSKKADSKNAILALLETNPAISIETIAEMLSLASSTVYEHLRDLRRKGIISRVSRLSPWVIHK